MKYRPFWSRLNILRGRPSGVALRASLMVENHMHTVYILKSQKDNNLYVGCTSDLKKRLQEHDNGLVFSTKSRRPLGLIYAEQYEDKHEAFNQEKFYKTAKGKKILKTKLYEQNCGVV